MAKVTVDTSTGRIESTDNNGPLSNHDAERMAGAVARVCELYGVTAAQLVEYNRHPVIAEARHAAYYVLYIQLKLSYPDIGRAFGRHHTTVRGGVARFTAMIENNLDLSERIADLRAAVTIH
jgi:chromosomal replication initiation ATPase DnaA